MRQVRKFERPTSSNFCPEDASTIKLCFRRENNTVEGWPRVVATPPRRGPSAGFGFTVPWKAHRRLRPYFNWPQFWYTIQSLFHMHYVWTLAALLPTFLSEHQQYVFSKDLNCWVSHLNKTIGENIVLPPHFCIFNEHKCASFSADAIIDKPSYLKFKKLNKKSVTAHASASKGYISRNKGLWQRLKSKLGRILMKKWYQSKSAAPRERTNDTEQTQKKCWRMEEGWKETDRERSKSWRLRGD